MYKLFGTPFSNKATDAFALNLKFEPSGTTPFGILN